MISWNDPDNLPAAPGEYLASLDPTDTSLSIRRWWSGQAWSNPYFVGAPASLKARIRQEQSKLMVYWAPVSELVAHA